MNCREYGTEHRETIFLLHGGGLSWWSCREAAELLQARWHVVLPILDGHAGSDRSFTTIEENAAELIRWIDERLGGSVLLIGGLSLGAQVLLEMLSQRGDICRHAFVESAAVLPDKLTHALIGPAFGSSYGLMKRRSFAKLQFRSLHIKPELFEEYYRDTCAIAKPDLVAFLKASTVYTLKSSLKNCTAEVHLFAGEKETRTVLRSIEAIRAVLPGCDATILPGLYHGEFSINHPADYARMVEAILQK